MSQQRSRCGAFTIAELIIVMMIIVLLVAILLPALGAARARAKKVASKAQLASIVAACESYQLAFQSQPGYFSEAELGSGATKLWKDLTSTENLVLSLLGRVVPAAAALCATWTPTGHSTLRVLLDEIGTGPKSTNAQVYGAFYSPKPDELGSVSYTRWPTMGDANQVPALLDTVSGLPILYFRADPAGTVPVSGPQGGANFCRVNTVNDYCRADALETAYSGGPKNQKDDSILSYDLNGDPGVPNQIAWITTSEKLSTGAINTSGNVLKGRVVLLAPGTDGVYMSKDQLGGNTITDYDDLEKFDDNIASGG